MIYNVINGGTNESKCKWKHNNGKDCYQVVNNVTGTIYYIDKETGLTIRIIGEHSVSHGNSQLYDVVTDFQYKFDVVTDNDFIEPNISE